MRLLEYLDRGDCIIYYNRTTYTRLELVNVGMRPIRVIGKSQGVIVIGLILKKVDWKLK